MSVILIKVLQFLVSLSLLVMIHEFGHYISARIFKIRVEKFYLFFNPWFSLYKRKIGDTTYGIGWLPLGGYVSLSGMIDESMNTEQMKQEPQPWEFRTKPAWQRLIVMLAGVFMNVILAMIIFSGMLFTWGETYVDNANVKYGYEFNEVGEKLGFEDGDKIVSIDGEAIRDIQNIRKKLILSGDDRKVEIIRHNEPQTLSITQEQFVDMRASDGLVDLYTVINEPYIVEEVATEDGLDSGFRQGDQIVAIGDKALYSGVYINNELMAHKGEEVTITVLRYEDGAPIRDTITTRLSDEGKIANVKFQAVEALTETHVEYGFFESIPAGIKAAGNEIASYWNQLKMIVDPDNEMYKEVGGFLSIGSIFPDTWDWSRFWYLTALLSIMLAVMNLLPIPGLDGGHALFTLWEIITRRKPSDKFMEVMQWIGLIILFALLIYANGNDIFKLFS